jgi:glycosyltransferase involved in cell wall biosynthesis
VVAESTRLYLIGQGIPPEKIKIVPNGIDAKFLASADASPAQIREGYGLRHNFIVSYIGTHGLSHALDVVLQAAKKLQSEPAVHFLFVGEGAEKERLKRLSDELQLSNSTFVDEQPREKILAFYRASDVSLVPLKRLPIFRKVLPSKLFELMGIGCPVICSVEGEAADLVARAEAGLCIEPENAEVLVKAIKRLQTDQELRKRMGLNGQQFAKTHYLRSKLAEEYLNALISVVFRQWSVRGRQQPARDRETWSTDN